MKKQGPSLAYLEQVRQHLARLPSIDPNTRTIILCGYPNVGKSSFMNKVTRADVDVQPYAFTTKSLFVGHTDYKYLRWQIIDTPGILDHPLEERNTIEMLAITALAHLRSAVVFIIDISEHCGYTIEQQVALFQSIKPLFTNKPLVVALNKIDAMPPDQLREEAKQLLKSLEQHENVSLIAMSALTEEGVSRVKEFACQKLLDMRLDIKLNTLKQDEVLRRLHVATPVARDQRERPPQIPSSVRQQRILQSHTEPHPPKQVTSKAVDLENINYWLKGDTDPEWDPTVFGPDWRNQFILANDEWKFDAIPEIMDGMNVADWIDPEIMQRLRELELEEESRLETLQSEMAEEEPFRLTEEEVQALRDLREQQNMARLNHRLKKGKTTAVLPHKHRAERTTVEEFEEHLSELGIDPSNAAARVRSRSRSRGIERGRKRSRSEGAESRAPSRSKTPQQEGFKDKKQKVDAEKKAKKAQKAINKASRKGEADRHIYNLKPKHLFSGKRGLGKTDRR